MVYIRTRVDVDQDILAPGVSTGIIALLTPAEMVAHAVAVYIRTHVDAGQVTLAFGVSVETTVTLTPAEMVVHA